MKYYNLWLMLILLALYTADGYLADIRTELRAQNALLRGQAAPAPSPAGLGWLRHGRPRHVGAYRRLAEAHLDSYRRYHPEQLPSYAR